MPSTHKKVIVRKQDRDSISGYVAPSNFVVDGKLELLNTSGNVVAIDLRDIKAVYFVREFSDTDLMLRKTFTTRPRTEGLWVRLKFKDNEVIEGILPNDLTQNPAEGFLMNPPDLRSNTQGRATHTMQFEGYEEVPPNIAEKIVEQRTGEPVPA